MGIVSNIVQLANYAFTLFTWKGALEKSFAAIVDQMGGTYYSGGFGTTRNPGQLDDTNFRVGAGLGNEFKFEPNSVFPMQAYLDALTAVATFTTWVPAEIAASCVEVRCSCNAVTPSGTANITVKVAGSAVATFNISGQTAYGPFASTVAVTPGTLVKIEVVVNSFAGGATTVENMEVCLWMKAAHQA